MRRGDATVIHKIHRKGGEDVAGPENPKPESSHVPAPEPPPGHFLSPELETDCARFLEDMRALVRRREQEVARLGLLPPA